MCIPGAGGFGGLCFGLDRGLFVTKAVVLAVICGKFMQCEDGEINPTPLSSLHTVWAVELGNKSLNRL